MFQYSYSEFFSQLDVDYCNVAASVILFWDHILTSGDEVDHIWKRRFTGATALFLLNRYSTFIKTVLGYVTVFTSSPSTCRWSQYAYQVFDLIALFVFAAFSAFRVWAIWGRELRPFLVVLPFCLVTPVLNLYRVTQATPIFDHSLPIPFGGCGTDYGLPLSLYIMFSDIVRAIAIATDALVLIMTWIKTRSIYKAVRRVKVGTGLSELLIRDGTLYFGSLLLFNVVDLIVNHTAANFNPVNYFNDVVNCILISRFMLNLRAVNANPYERAVGTSTTARGVIQSNFFGDLGGPLVYSSSDEESGAVYECSQFTELEEFERENGPLAVGLRGWRSAEDLRLSRCMPLHTTEALPPKPRRWRSTQGRRRVPSEGTDSVPSTPRSHLPAAWLPGPSRIRKQKSEEIMVVARERA